MTRRALSLVLLSFAVTVAAIAGSAQGHEPARLPMERRETHIAIENFTARDEAGHPFEFNKLRGKVVVVAFAYTTCPDVCPLITAALRQVQSRLLKIDRQQVHLLTVTTDPEIDSPEVLTAYAKRFGAERDSWSFLSGTEFQLRKIWKSFGVGVKRKGRGLIDHTPLTALVDRRGVMRVAFIGASPDPKRVLADVHKLLNEK